MKKLTREEVKTVQMDILDALVKFCDQNSLRISVSSGTLIGAVRHKGYIPWDDDIDVYMPRGDYMKLEKILPELLDGKYKLASLYRLKNWHLTFAKLYDIRTETKLQNRSVIPYGVFVDIFPVDDVPENPVEFKSYMRKLGLMRFLLNNVRQPTAEMPFFRKVLIRLHHAIISLIPNRKLVLFREKYNQKYNNLGYKVCYANSYGPLQHNPFPKEMFDDIILWNFEDRKVPGFRNADKFLRLQYGNYLQLPPESERKCHSEIAYWKDN